ncbi:tetratricopeptide repeat 28-like [Olea europaea subsp. europaea]|uniref:Tetratricopeptide repeat 28-like n=1 Tax=Olea europaea subsp. europaea TaxID=158383 RepID=A0A8S0SQI0_OLEEU|nr:tetratricopeptide repeat 28-like [Olea europaea subsp. europaea]
MDLGQNHALAKFSGCMQLGDTYAMLGYLAEAHVQAMQFDEAETLYLMALDIHKKNESSASPEEAADRRLLGLICESKGDYEVASVFVRLADLYNKIGKFNDSKSYCENALRIYSKPVPGSLPEEIARGLVDISAIYESMNEPDKALQLLQKVIKVYGNAPGQQTTIAGTVAQMGVLYYILGSYSDSYTSLKNAISKFRATGEKKSAIFGNTLTQMGLACAADFFEEARGISEAEYGPYHADTLGVYSNLAGTYDAMGR